VRQFLTFHRAADGTWRHPATLGTADVEAFLNDLVVRRRLSASAQNQALCALVFLYEQVLQDVIPQDHLGKFLLQRSRRPRRLPTVLSTQEVRRVLDAVPADHICRLPLELLYGTGVRVAELCALRVRDIDFGRGQVIVRAGKGDKDRVVMLPMSLHCRLGEQVAAVERQWRDDLARGGGHAPVPDALRHKRPRAGHEWPWQFVFPSGVLRRDTDGRGTRWHLHPASLERTVYRASNRARIGKRVTCHTFRQLRHPPAGKWLRRAAGANIARTLGVEDDHDLHARDEQAGDRGEQSARPASGYDGRRVMLARGHSG
jgi:integrase